GNRTANVVCGFEIYPELKLRWLVHRQIGRLRALYNFVYISGRATKQISVVRPIVHESTCIQEPTLTPHRRQAVLCRQLRDRFSVRISDCALKYEESPGVLSHPSFECAFEIGGAPYFDGV